MNSFPRLGILAAKFSVSILFIPALALAEQVRPGGTREVFGKTEDGAPVEIFTLRNSHGLKARVMTWGATLVSMEAPDRDGKLADVTLGFDSLDGYLGKHPFFGVIAGRYANRIAKGKFTLDGKDYTLAVNNGVNHLHGGIKGFDKKNWRADFQPGTSVVSFSLMSPDGDEGYPGNLIVRVVYTLSQDDELHIYHEVTADQGTVVNLTNHTYWNLAGAGAGDILGHELTLHADKFTPVDDGSIPTGKIDPVAGGPMDFTKGKAIGRDIAQLSGTPGGYDHNFVINQSAPKSKIPSATQQPAAELYDPKSGRVMQVRTSEPGVQFYTGNYLDGTITGKGGKAYPQHSGVCLETQHFPDSPNRPNFPSTVLRPGKKYISETSFAFSVR